MPQPLFDVFFRGALLPGADPGEARDRLAALFGLGPTEVQRLLIHEHAALSAPPERCLLRAVDMSDVLFDFGKARNGAVARQPRRPA